MDQQYPFIASALVSAMSWIMEQVLMEVQMLIMWFGSSSISHSIQTRNMNATG